MVSAGGPVEYEDEAARRAVTGWLLCGLAVVGMLGLRYRFETHIDQVDTVEFALTGPERTDTTGSIAPADRPSPSLRLDTGPTDGQPPGAVEEPGDGEGRIGRSSDGNEDPLWVNPRSSGLPWSSLGAVDGLLTFRGNPTRSFHGLGPVPSNPEIMWQRTIGCSNSPVGGEPKQWCGTGWTGQPAVFPRPGSDDGFWVGVGGYNRSVNFFDPVDGTDVYPAIETGDIIKGSITVDPDGYPLVYTGSRDNFFHVVAIDGSRPRELWTLSSASTEPTLWNNDWDSSALVVGDHLFVGGENSRFYVVELNRGFDRAGLVTVEPEVVFSTEGWDDDLLAAIGDTQVSIENSVAISGTVVYFTNSGGLVQGWDVAGLTAGREPKRVFRYWTGDDTDGSIVVDAEGMLYVASEFERGNQRSRDLGQVFKLDPSKPDDPLVWSRTVTDRRNSGVWATPALYRDLLIVPTDDGEVIGFDRETGRTRWTIALGGPLWSSPVVVGDTLIQGDCNGVLHAFDLGDTGRTPRPRWQVELSGCIESTPAVWGGAIYVGTRSGEFFAVADRRSR